MIKYLEEDSDDKSVTKGTHLLQDKRPAEGILWNEKVDLKPHKYRRLVSIMKETKKEGLNLENVESLFI